MSKKKQGQRDKVLEMLRTGATSEQFVEANVLRYSARIKELRDAGYVISGTHRVEHAGWLYRLESEPVAA